MATHALLALCVLWRLGDAVQVPMPTGTGSVKYNRTTTAFKNVLLVLHCELHDDAICASRWPVMKGYEEYFGKVYYMTRNECKDDKSLCLMDLMETEGSKYDGIFYMHFDALILPCRLAKVFDKDALGLSTRPGENGVSADQKRLIKGPEVVDDSIFGVDWSPKVQEQWDKSIEKIRTFAPEPQSLNASRIFASENDLFYIPKAAYKGYGDLEDEFAYNGVWHEVAGPSTRKFLEDNYKIPAVNYGCRGGCCQNLDMFDLSHEEFRCGHKFDLREEHIQKGIAQSLEDRSDC